MTILPSHNPNPNLTTTTTKPEMPHYQKHSPRSTIAAATTATRTSFSFFSPKLSVYLCSICVTLFILFHIKILQTPLPSSQNSLSFLHNWQEKLINNDEPASCNDDITSMGDKLRESVTFLPLKDLRFANAALVGHTWFISSLYDTHEEGEVQYQQFPSKSSNRRILCIKGRDNHDGSWNYYGLAYPGFLPKNATLVPGRTFVSYNHYDFGNIWHGLSALVPFVAWHLKSECAAPDRWILYHWGEVRTGMSPWLNTLMEATFNGPLNIEKFEDPGNNYEWPMCYEEAVVMRHNEGGMSREKRMEVYDLIRCKARMMCDVELDRTDNDIGLTLFMRTGPRSFRNETTVVEIFERECMKVENCRLKVAYSSNLTVCEQVRLMASTDILVSPHGAQLTNMFLMDRNSSVLEFFPKGWLKLAGVGQLVYHWIASWSGMKHQGAWRDTEGDPCPYPDDDRRCMSVYKNGRIGYNSTYFSEWASRVLNEVKMRKSEEATMGNIVPTKCACS